MKRPRCQLCQEPLGNAEHGEFFDPANFDADSIAAHADCALARGMEVA